MCFITEIFSSIEELIKIHRMLKFKKSNWMKKYIDFNTKKIKSAANDFEKDFFNLILFMEKQWRI